ncbi:MAG: hypothetical protein H7A45_09250 [Verrucomicrobiales bacterium]|nr:hypothetical protein [Verrucomicrobiales bacterium]MCP5526194.1 hypothetical protein [Verrucomicrobiales bacterium]
MRPTATPRIRRRPPVGRLALPLLMLLAGCHTPSRELGPLPTNDADDSVQSYVDGLIDSPEMFPRARTISERYVELRLNYAMQKAIEDGRLHVRAIAAPLQLSGDPNLDMSRTHTILLVADDLQAGSAFLDEYEVRVGPAPQLAVVRPATSADSLAEADTAYAEEQLLRVRLDEQSLKADARFAASLKRSLPDYLAEARKAHEERRPRLTTLVKTLDDSIAELQEQLGTNTNRVQELARRVRLQLDPEARAQTEKELKALREEQAKLSKEGDQGSEANRKRLADVTARIQGIEEQLNNQPEPGDAAELVERTRQQAEIRLRLIRGRNDLDEAEGLLREEDERFQNLERTVEGLGSSDLSVAAALAAVESRRGFWQTEIEAERKLSTFSKQRDRYVMSTAVVVAFRAQALAGLPYVTIEVIRKGAPAVVPGDASPGTTKDPDPLDELLSHIDEALPELNGLLMAEERVVKDDSRWRRIKYYGDELAADAGKLSGILELRALSGAARPPARSAGPADDRDVFASWNDVQQRLARHQAALEELAENEARLAGSLAGSTNRLARLDADQEALLRQVERGREVLADALRNVREAVASSGDLPPDASQALLLFSGVEQGLQTLDEGQQALQAALEGSRNRVTDVGGAVRESEAASREVAAGRAASRAEVERIRAVSDRLHEDIRTARDLQRRLIALSESIQGRLGVTPQDSVLGQVGGVSEVAPPRESLLTKALEGVAKDLCEFREQLSDRTLASARGRQDAAGKLSDLRKTLAKARYLAGAVEGKDAGQRTAGRASGGGVTFQEIFGLDSGLDSGPDAGPAPAPAPDEKATPPPPPDMVDMIRAGNLAVFRFNVLRGVVSTTAYLMPDDGVKQTFGKTFADTFYVAQVTFRNPNDKPILVYGNTMRLVVRMNSLVPGQITEEGEPARTVFWATYEPLDYEGVRLMLEGIQERSWQKWAARGIDLVQIGLATWAAFDPPKDALRAIAMFGGVAPSLRALLEADLKRHAANFRARGLNAIEEIEAQGTLTRVVFLPKGPIYGSFAFDKGAANALSGAADNPESRQFGRRAMVPVYIHDIRREEVYVEGKRILASDPLSSTGIR